MKYERSKVTREISRYYNISREKTLILKKEIYYNLDKILK